MDRIGAGVEGFAEGDAVLIETHGWCRRCEFCRSGAEAVFDFVGVDATMELALRSARILGCVALVGAGGGSVRIGWESLPRDCEVWSPQGGTNPELHEVVSLCQRHPVKHRVERFAFDDTPLAYARLRAGDLVGRAVVLPAQ